MTGEVIQPRRRPVGISLLCLVLDWLCLAGFASAWLLAEGRAQPLPAWLGLVASLYAVAAGTASAGLWRMRFWGRKALNAWMKAPKLHMGDTGLACALMGVDAATLLKERERLGPLLETFVLQKLRRQASWRRDPIEFFHYRDRDDFEVDIVLEFGSTAVAGVEVKAAATVVESDFRGLRKLREAAAQRFKSVVVLYDGTASVNFGDGLFAVPLRRLWESR